MDSLTQAVLGGTVTYAILGKRLGKRAALYGAALGTLPDLDVLIDFGGPVENMTHHRGFSHAFVVQALAAPVLAWLAARPKSVSDPFFLRWCVAIYLCFLTHTLADFFTVYGTQVLWPFTDYPFAHSLLFIIDPIYTLPLLVGFLGALLVKSIPRALSLNAWMLSLSTLYLIWSASAKVMIDDKVIAALEAKGVSPGIYESTPGPFNTFLWRSVAIEGNDYFEIWTSIFDDVSEVQVRRYPRNLELIEAVSNHPSVRRLQWFTKGQYKAWESDNKIFISDLRMGVEGAYVFNFEVGLRKLSGIEIGSFQQLERRPRLNQVGQIWRRIFDPTISITDRSQPLTN